MWSDIWFVLRMAGAALFGPLVRALREGEPDRASDAARIVAETIAFKLAVREARRR